MSNNGNGQSAIPNPSASGNPQSEMKVVAQIVINLTDAGGVNVQAQGFQSPLDILGAMSHAQLALLGEMKQTVAQRAEQLKRIVVPTLHSVPPLNGQG